MQGSATGKAPDSSKRYEEALTLKKQLVDIGKWKIFAGRNRGRRLAGKCGRICADFTRRVARAIVRLDDNCLQPKDAAQIVDQPGSFVVVKTVEIALSPLDRGQIGHVFEPK